MGRAQRFHNNQQNRTSNSKALPKQSNSNITEEDIIEDKVNSVCNRVLYKTAAVTMGALGSVLVGYIFTYFPLSLRQKGSVNALLTMTLYSVITGASVGLIDCCEHNAIKIGMFIFGLGRLYTYYQVINPLLLKEECLLKVCKVGVDKKLQNYCYTQFEVLKNYGIGKNAPFSLKGITFLKSVSDIIVTSVAGSFIAFAANSMKPCAQSFANWAEKKIIKKKKSASSI